MSDIPKPITRKDAYYSYLINGKSNLPTPITREDNYLYYLCQKGFGGGAVTPEMIQSAVNNYLDANPVQAGATAEQVQQIEDNKNAIGQLQKDVKTLQESSGGGEETTNYENLTNKPQINDITLVGNKKLEEIGIKTNNLDIDFSTYF